jgi:hypothetical protein
MISGQTLRACPEGKPVPTFPDHALARQNAAGRQWVQPGFSAPHVVIGGGFV